MNEITKAAEPTPGQLAGYARQRAQRAELARQREEARVAAIAERDAFREAHAAERIARGLKPIDWEARNASVMRHARDGDQPWVPAEPGNPEVV